MVTAQICQAITVYTGRSPPTLSCCEMEDWWREGNSINILVFGKTGTGKSTLVNAILGQEVADVGETLHPETTEVTSFRAKIDEIKVKVWDSPGLQDGLKHEADYLRDIEASCKDKVDLFIYCVSMQNACFVQGNRDIVSMCQLTEKLGREIWNHAIIILTQANVCLAKLRSSITTSDCDIKIKTSEMFNRRLEEWKEKLKKCLHENLKLSPETIAKMPILPAGRKGHPLLNSSWLSKIWIGSLLVTRHSAIPALIKVNHQVLSRASDIHSERQFQQLLNEEGIFTVETEQPEAFQAVNRVDVVIESEIGCGGWATVRAGKYLGSVVAIKQPHQMIMQQSTVDRMKREASNMARMHHPNLVTFIGAVFDDGLPMVITELMEANLRATYNATNLTEEQNFSIFKDVAYALHYLHEFRDPIIHRDVSAPNVLLNSLPGNRYIAKVSDFGSANLEKRAFTGGEGAIIYSAPESFPDMFPKVKQTVKMDSYSYGVLLCEVVSRKFPSNLDEMVGAMTGKWRDLVVRCIKHDPKERPTMAEILRQL